MEDVQAAFFQGLEAIKRFFFRCLGIFPRSLPRGRPEFDRFCGHIFRAYDLPQTDGYRQAVATMIMHLPPTEHKASPRYFAHSIRKAMSNEVAYYVIQESKKNREAMSQSNEVATTLN